MVSVSAVVVAHTARTAHAYPLAQTLGASLVMDDGSLGGRGNHARAWQLHDTASDWCLVAEDDAILCTNFMPRLTELLPTAPSPVVSLYLGTGYPLHLVEQAAHAQADAELRGDDWLTLPTMNHAVAIAIRQSLVADMLTCIDLSLPIDEGIGAWARQAGHEVSYPTLSLVDHRDEPTLTQHPDGIGRTRPRRALRFAG